MWPKWEEGERERKSVINSRAHIVQGNKSFDTFVRVKTHEDHDDDDAIEKQN